ncbi:MAG: hypothetical protein H6658_00330 [Ardenticatenaceae bacterium]|nr:hypothetical protein [Ardenticatenaceae bacterium]
MNGAAVAAIAAAIAQATKASGAIVRMPPEDFLTLLDRVAEPLVVMAMGGLINKNYQYLVGYKGLVFFTKSSDKLPLPPKAELITADKIWIPD